MTLWSSYQHADEYEESGRFDELLDWLRENIYRHGRKFTASELLERIGFLPYGVDDIRTERYGSVPG